MARIEIIKTWYGNRYAVVDDFKHYPVSRNAKGEIITKKNGKREETLTEVAYTKHAVEYSVGKGEENIRVAIFSLDKEGLKRAKEVLALYNKGNKKA